MIDVHTHILPQIDDGSSSVKESLRLIEMIKSAKTSTGKSDGVKIDRIAATSHFYGTQYRISEFLELRNEAFADLQKVLPADSPKIHLGAEVLYFPGISKVDGLEQLMIEDSDLLLLEMPFSEWSERMVNDVIDMAHCGRFCVLLAHIDRYFAWNNPEVFDILAQNGVRFQLNADSLTKFGQKHKLCKMIKYGGVRFIGSDCHSEYGRPPLIGEAFRTIDGILGKDGIDFLEKQVKKHFV